MQVRLHRTEADDLLRHRQRRVDRICPKTWSPFRLIGFRFLFSYLALYWLPFLIPLWTVAVPVFGRWLGVEAVRRPNGSGDTMFHWVQCLAVLVPAVVAAAV